MKHEKCSPTITGQRLEHELGLILSEAEPQKMLSRLQEPALAFRHPS